MERRIYVVSLAAYNHGISHGAWIDVEQDYDSIMSDIYRILETSPIQGEEYAIHDVENMPYMSEYEDISDIKQLIDLYDEHGDDELVNKVYQYHDHVEHVVDMLDRYLGKYDSLESYAAELFEDQVNSSLPENLRCYFDYEALGRDLELGGDIETLDANDGCVYVFSCR